MSSLALAGGKGCEYAVLQSMDSVVLCLSGTCGKLGEV